MPGNENSESSSGVEDEHEFPLHLIEFHLRDKLSKDDLQELTKAFNRTQRHPNDPLIANDLAEAISCISHRVQKEMNAAFRAQFSNKDFDASFSASHLQLGENSNPRKEERGEEREFDPDRDLPWEINPAIKTVKIDHLIDSKPIVIKKTEINQCWEKVNALSDKIKTRCHLYDKIHPNQKFLEETKDVLSEFMASEEKYFNLEKKLKELKAKSNSYEAKIDLPEDHKNPSSPFETKSIRKHLDQCNGQTENDFKNFYVKLLNYGRSMQYSHDNYMQALSTLLQGPIFETFNKMKTNGSSLHEIITALHNMYMKSDTPHDYKEQLSNFQRNANEPLKSAMNRFSILLHDTQSLYPSHELKTRKRMETEKCLLTIASPSAKVKLLEFKEEMSYSNYQADIEEMITLASQIETKNRDIPVMPIKNLLAINAITTDDSNLPTLIEMAAIQKRSRPISPQSPRARTRMSHDPKKDLYPVSVASHGQRANAMKQFATPTNTRSLAPSLDPIKKTQDYVNDLPDPHNSNSKAQPTNRTNSQPRTEHRPQNNNHDNRSRSHSPIRHQQNNKQQFEKAPGSNSGPYFPASDLVMPSKSNSGPKSSASGHAMPLKSNSGPQPSASSHTKPSKSNSGPQVSNYVPGASTSTSAQYASRGVEAKLAPKESNPNYLGKKFDPYYHLKIRGATSNETEGTPIINYKPQGPNIHKTHLHISVPKTLPFNFVCGVCNGAVPHNPDQCRAILEAHYKQNSKN